MIRSIHHPQLSPPLPGAEKSQPREEPRNGKRSEQTPGTIVPPRLQHSPLEAFQLLNRDIKICRDMMKALADHSQSPQGTLEVIEKALTRALEEVQCLKAHEEAAWQ